MVVRASFCTSADGTRIAYAVQGSGPPLVWIGTWPSHLLIDVKSLITGPLIDELSKSHTLVRFDIRGTGLSQRDASDFRFERLLQDLEAVVDALRLRRLSLMGHAQGAAMAACYAARHPDRCDRIVLVGSYLRGRIARIANAAESEQNDLFDHLIKAGWDAPTPAFRRVFSSLFFPDATATEWAAWDEVQKQAARGDTALGLTKTFGSIDLSDCVSQVDAPTLVIHCDGDLRVPVDQGRQLAASVRGADFVSLPCRNHYCLSRDAAWPEFLALLLGFLIPRVTTSEAWQSPPSFARRLPNSLTAREEEVVELIAAGMANAEISTKLTISPNTLRNHIARIFVKLEVSARAQAIVKAREAGFGVRRH
jgi:pimeloyl-ACP methyl ester carboxylesterase/DNA-binding CsgD family transcriptional regulator